MPSIATETRAGAPGSPGGRLRRDELALLALALLVRLLHWFAIRGEPLYDFPVIDARIFWQAASALEAGRAAAAVFYKPPLLVYLLSTSIRLFGENPGAARLLLLVVSAFAAPLTARLARPILGRFGAIIAGVLTAVFAPAVFYGAELLPATIVLVLNLLLLIALARGERSGDPRTFGFSGVLLGISALARPTTLVFLPLLLIRYRRLRTCGLLLVVGAVLGVAPATIHNMRAGDLVLVSSNGGVNFYMGNHEGADGRSAGAPDLPSEPGEAERAARTIAEREMGRSLAPSEVSNYWYRRGLSWATGEPLDAVALGGRKLYYACNNEDISDNIDLRAIRERSPVMRFPSVGFGALFAFALLGALRLRRSREGRLLLVYGAAIVVPLVLFFVVGRFRLPLLPVLSIGAAAGLAELRDAYRRRPRDLVAPVALILAGLLLSHSPFFGVKEDRTWHYHYLSGYTLYRKGDVAGAIEAYEEAVARNPRVPSALNALGFLYAEIGENLDRGAELIERAMELEPARRRHYLDSLGWILLRQGKLERAATVLEEAVSLFPSGEEPFRAEAMRHLADVRAAQGRAGGADSLRAQAGALHSGR
jgi:4-amino-4-deoxy-L-arabinose transferase-like glycosyltransferase